MYIIISGGTVYITISRGTVCVIIHFRGPSLWHCYIQGAQGRLKLKFCIGANELLPTPLCTLLHNCGGLALFLGGPQQMISSGGPGVLQSDTDNRSYVPYTDKLGFSCVL